MPSIVSPRLEMIAHHYGVEAGFLRGHREFQKIARAELLGRCFVAYFQH